MEVRRNIYEANGKQVTDTKVKPSNGTNGTLEDSLKEEIPKKFCRVCGTDCTRAYWHNSKSSPKIDICPDCFKHSTFPNQHNRSDYVKMENKSYTLLPDRDSAWTDEETLLLLEGLEMYEDDWNKISDHIGTRSREEAVLKFLQLEIEDPYVEPEPAPKESALAVSYLGEQPIPFSHTENPILSTMAYLAGIADPTVTAAAAGKSIAQVQSLIRARINNESATNGDSTDLVEKAQDAATTLPFALSAARASALASHEERTLTRLVHLASNMQHQKLTLKLNQFAELEKLIKLERKDVERRRQALFLERLEFQRRMRAVEDALAKAVINPDSKAGMEAIGRVVGGAVGKGSVGVGVGGKVEEDGGDVKPLSEEAGAEGFTTFAV
jgi:SWI/SNF related-matrix-associated actin-dependent regulator of chromatin subfamily C